jgi:hypothetical protein
MMRLVSLFIPWLPFFFIGKPLEGLLSIFLQITIIGWLPAVIWVNFALSDYYTKEHFKKYASR